jgi:hypothetical protein
MRTRFIDRLTLDFAAVAPAKATQEGARLVVRDAIVARSGILTYRRRDGSALNVLRRPEDMRSAEVLRTYELLPLTNEHPPESELTPQRVQRVQVGATGSVARAEEVGDGEVVARVDVAIHAAPGIDAARAGRRQFSHGYYAALTPAPEGATWRGVPYEMIQTPLEGDHIALVDMARAGAVTEFLLDGADPDVLVQDETPPQEDDMKVRIKDGKITHEVHADDQALVEGLIAERDKAQGEAAALAVVQAERDKAAAERDEAIARLAALDAAEASRRLTALREQAARYLRDAAPLATMDEGAIKRAVLKHFGVTLAEDASEVAVGAAYDAVVQAIKPKVLRGGEAPSKPAEFAPTQTGDAAAPAARRSPGDLLHGRLRDAKA